ncbi:MAG TPA: hypothetical protein VII57_00200 [Dehalococcoidia bacterium]
MQEKIMNLSLGEKLVAGGGVLMVIFSFLPWHHFSADIEGIVSVSFNRSAWQSPDALWSMLAVLISVAMAVVVLGPKLANMQLPNLGTVTWGQAMLVGGVAVLILVLLKFISETSYLGFGFYLGFIDAVAIAYGGYLLYTEERAAASH